MSINKSEHDGMDLPRVWNHFTSDQKLAVIRYINGHTGHLTLPKGWLYDMTTSDRRRVRRHLEMVGFVKVREMPRTTRMTGQNPSFPFPYGTNTGRMSSSDRAFEESIRHKGSATYAADAMRILGGKTVHIIHDMQERGLHIEQRVIGGMLYAKPNGGNRMLPSMYGQLRTYWVRGSGQKQIIATMNEGHLDNTLKLLKESHGNVIGRSSQLLGKMHRHFQNQPNIRAKLEELLKLMEQVEVDQMYPIFGTLAQELASRKEEVEIDLEWDDILKDW